MDLLHALEPLGVAAAPSTGPRRWWGGPLDVEGLAIDSVRLLGGAVRRLAGEAMTTSTMIAAAFDSFGRLRVDGRRPQAFASLSRFAPAADGWVRLHANYPQHRAALERAFGGDADRILATIAELPALEVEARAFAAGGVAAAVRTAAQWRELAGRSMSLRVEPGDERTAVVGGTAGPLAGVRVLELCRVIAGPVAGRMLAALGADVLRIDPPHLPELIDQHLDTGFGKRSVVADLGVAADLAAAADVVLLGYRPGALAPAGLDAQALRRAHPHLVIGELDAWGDSGLSGRRGFDSIVQAATGIADRYAHDGRPGALPVQALDHAAGYSLAAGAIALLAARRAGIVRISLADLAVGLLARPVPDDPVEPLEDDPLHRADSPYGVLDYVAPPLVIAGHRLDFAAPHRYGTDAPSWHE